MSRKSFIRSVLGLPPRKIAIKEITAGVAKLYGVTVEDIYGRGRDSDVVMARQEVWRRAYFIGNSYSKIGRVFGRDHSTIYHGVKAAQRRRDLAFEPDRGGEVAKRATFPLQER